MDAHLPERAPTLARVGAPAGRAGGRGPVVAKHPQSPDPAVRERVVRRDHLAVQPQVEADRGDTVAVGGRRDQVVGFAQLEHERLLDQNVAAGGERRERDAGVHGRRRADGDRVEPVVGRHRGGVVVDALDAEPLRRFPRGGGVGVRHGAGRDAVDLLQGGQVQLSDAAAASDPDREAHGSTLTRLTAQRDNLRHDCVVRSGPGAGLIRRRDDQASCSCSATARRSTAIS